MGCEQQRWGPLLVVFVLLIATIAQAGEMEDMKREVETLKEKVKKIEEKETEVRDGEGHRLHPIRSLLGTKMTGGLTGIVQGSLNNEGRFGGNRTEGSMSADLFVEVTVHEKGLFLLRMDIAQGAGLASLPPLFANPDGNATGPNNDIESFDNSQSLNINEARYEQMLLDDTLRIVFGHIDLTSYFDENEFANKETFQYIAQHFNNNIAIDWGGTGNFFGPGAVLVVDPDESLWDVSLGWFEGDGNYDRMFRQPFLMGQLALEPKFDGREGEYRFYGWGRFTPHCKSSSNSAVFSNCDLIETPADRVRIKSGNSGFGISLDQELSDSVGVWARFGYQDPDVSQFDKAMSGGVVFSKLRGRPHDILGLAYGAVFPAGDYKVATGRSDIEHYAEVYYKYVPFGDGILTGLHLTPDLQVVANPGGDGTVDPILIWGFRTQVSF
jgi:hypothetical protein